MNETNDPYFIYDLDILILPFTSTCDFKYHPLCLEESLI